MRKYAQDAPTNFAIIAISLIWHTRCTLPDNPPEAASSASEAANANTCWLRAHATSSGTVLCAGTSAVSANFNSAVHQVHGFISTKEFAWACNNPRDWSSKCSQAKRELKWDQFQALNECSDAGAIATCIEGFTKYVNGCDSVTLSCHTVTQPPANSSPPRRTPGACTTFSEN